MKKIMRRNDEILLFFLFWLIVGMAIAILLP